LAFKDDPVQASKDYIKPSSQFKRNGNDLEIELPVLFSTAILGGKVRIPIVDGAVEVTLSQYVDTSFNPQKRL
jgi:DnaJ-class molecular chaperone